MPRHRRFFPKNTVYLVTNRTAEGLPFLPCQLMNLFLFGILAKAKAFYPSVTISAFLFMGNHYHGILKTNGNAQEFVSFMNYVDGEIGRLINRLRGPSYAKATEGRRRHINTKQQSYPVKHGIKTESKIQSVV